MMAKHYCSQFHPAYNKDGIEALAKEAGVTELDRALHQEVRRRYRGQ